MASSTTEVDVAKATETIKTGPDGTPIHRDKFGIQKGARTIRRGKAKVKDQYLVAFDTDFVQCDATFNAFALAYFAKRSVKVVSLSSFICSALIETSEAIAQSLFLDEVVQDVSENAIATKAS